MSTALQFENLKNTRDLGGEEGADGRRIKKGLLYRSGYLQRAAKDDVKKLSALGLVSIIDFRSYNETVEQPDPELPGTVHIHLPAEDEQLLGIERDKDSAKRFTEILIDRVVADPSYAMKYMCDMYRRFAANAYTIGQYRKFLQLIYESPGPVLWHCTAGKDRAGFAAILLQEILGVSHEKIREDYLLSNVLLKEEVEGLVRWFAGMFKGPFPKEDVTLFFSAKSEFLETLYEEVRTRYGSFDGFLKEGFGIDDEMKERFRSKYLTEEAI